MWHMRVVRHLSDQQMKKKGRIFEIWLWDHISNDRSHWTLIIISCNFNKWSTDRMVSKWPTMVEFSTVWSCYICATLICIITLKTNIWPFMVILLTTTSVYHSFKLYILNQLFKTYHFYLYTLILLGKFDHFWWFIADH